MALDDRLVELWARNTSRCLYRSEFSAGNSFKHMTNLGCASCYGTHVWPRPLITGEHIPFHNSLIVSDDQIRW